MINSRVLTVLFLCATGFCAIAAPDASATSAKNLTIFECVEKGGLKDFADSHCKDKVSPNQGKFGHVEVALGFAAYIRSNLAVSNKTTESSPAIIKGTVLGLKLEIVCKTVTGKGEFQNSEPSSKVHLLSILADFIDLLECSVSKPALGCKVKEPISFSLQGEGVEGLGAGKNEMGVEYKPTGEHFTSLTLEGCLIAGTFNIDGTAIATGSPAPTEKHASATTELTPAMTKETLKMSGNPVEISSVTTISRKSNGAPLAPTTFT